MLEPADERFSHEALFYSSWADFLGGTVPFIRDGVEAGEPVLVVESRQKINMLREALGSAANHVQFADMAEVGANPARIIPAWQDFVDRHGTSSRRLRGIGEPIWKGRSSDELVECQRHEALLNAAFGDGRPWSLLCPYDTAQLDAAVIEEARRSHEFLREGDGLTPSESFASGSVTRFPLDARLPEPGPELLAAYRFDRDGLADMRDGIAVLASRAGMRGDRVADLVAAVNEAATNGIVHGAGHGVVRMWRERDRLVCDVRSRGTFDQPLADRLRPERDPSAPRGLWLANQLCNLVQIRSGKDGTTTVRLHMLLRPGPPLSVVRGHLD